MIHLGEPVCWRLDCNILAIMQLVNHRGCLLNASSLTLTRVPLNIIVLFIGFTCIMEFVDLNLSGGHDR